MKLPRRAVPPGTVTRMAPSLGARAVLRRFSISTGLERSLKSTGGVPSSAGGMGCDGGRSCRAVPCWLATRSQKFRTSSTAAEPVGTERGYPSATAGELANVRSRPATRNGVATYRPALLPRRPAAPLPDMSHLLGRQSQQAAQREDAAQVGECRHAYGGGQAAGRAGQSPRALIPRLLQEIGGEAA